MLIIGVAIQTANIWSIPTPNDLKNVGHLGFMVDTVVLPRFMCHFIKEKPKDIVEQTCQPARLAQQAVDSTFNRSNRLAEYVETSKGLFHGILLELAWVLANSCMCSILTSNGNYSFQHWQRV